MKLSSPTVGLLYCVIALSSLLAITNTHAQTSASDAVETSEVVLTEAEIEQALAPIALYPDSLLSHILIASTYPLEVVQAQRWISSREDLEPSEALQQVEDKDWDPSVKALVAFPRLLKRMSDDLHWTQKLGDAFLADEKGVLDSVQTLRQAAYESGNLESTDDIEVRREHKTIAIEPVQTKVVYVPYYDTRVVYGHWRWQHYPPIYWAYDDYYYGRYHHRHSHYHGHGLYWGHGVRLSLNFFFSGFHWRHHRIMVVNHRSHWRYNHHPRTRISYSISRHSDARHWRHDPKHRRGVHYRDQRTHVRYHGDRPRSRTSVSRAGYQREGAHRSRTSHNQATRHEQTRQGLRSRTREHNNSVNISTRLRHSNRGADSREHRRRDSSTVRSHQDRGQPHDSANRGTRKHHERASHRQRSRKHEASGRSKTRERKNHKKRDHRQGERKRR